MAFVLGSFLNVHVSLTFLVEAFSIGVFAAYWFIKGVGLKQTQADRIALEGNLVAY